MPKLWSHTIETHRQEVRDAILDVTSARIAKDGLHAVTMSQIAEETGIGRATLYKYFPDVEAILAAWHERHIAGHLAHLARIRDEVEGTAWKLEAVLETFAQIAHEHPTTELAALLHRGAHVASAQQHLKDLLQKLLAQAATEGVVRSDVAPRELATYCLHALTAAGALPSKTAVRRLVSLTLAGLRPDASL